MQHAPTAPASAAQRAGSPLILAHRGAWGALPQNSLQAFQLAIDLGCDGIELDVRRTADGRLVVVHDARIGGRAVTRLTHAELRERLAPGQAPLLDEVLELVAGRLLVDVELKEDGYVAAAVRTVAGRLHPGQYVVTSFVPEVLHMVKHALPEARTGLLIGRRRRRPELERRVRMTGVDFVAPHVSLARGGLLAWAADRELPAWVWTVNDPRVLRRLLSDYRVAAVITDRPAEALRNAG